MVISAGTMTEAENVVRLVFADKCVLIKTLNSVFISVLVLHKCILKKKKKVTKVSFPGKVTYKIFLLTFIDGNIPRMALSRVLRCSQMMYK